MSDPAITLAVESPRQAEVTRLLEALDAYQGALYPPESNHFLDVEALAAPNVRFIVARRGAAAVGCGALRIDGACGELKRMYVVPDARSRGVGRALLAALEDAGRRLGYHTVRLDAGEEQKHSRVLFANTDYREIPSFNANHIAVYFGEKAL